MSGYRLRPEYARFDAELKFDVGEIHTNEHPACIAGAILTGEKTPLDCTAYGTLCTPAEAARRADGVSSEGTCAAFFSAGRGLGVPARRSGARRCVQVAPIAPGGLADDATLASRGRRRRPPLPDPTDVACPAPIPEDERVHPGPRLRRPAVRAR